MSWAYFALFLLCALLSCWWGRFVGRKQERARAIATLHSFLNNVAWSGAVRDCIRLLLGAETITSLKLARDRERLKREEDHP